MIEKDFNHLQKHIRKVSFSLQEIFGVLDGVLTSNNKSFDVNFKGKDYCFHPASDAWERNRMQKNRQQLIHKLLKHCSRNLITILKTSLSDPLKEEAVDKVWEMVLAFSMGEDPRDHQFEFVSDDSHSNDTDAKDSRIIGSLGVETIPLDQESSHIQHQNPGLYDESVGL